MNDFEITSALDPWSLFAYKIIERAVYDWRLLMHGCPPDTKVSMDEIRHFLKSRWCADLLDGFCVSGEWVLQKLEEELAGQDFRKEKSLVNERKMANKKVVTVDGKTASIYNWCKVLGLTNGTVYKMYNDRGRKVCEQYLADVKKRRGL